MAPDPTTVPPSSSDPSGISCISLQNQSRTVIGVLTDDANLINVRTFVMAGRFLSFKAAARYLCLTPGAVSHRIAKLEDLLGFPLFRRLTRGIALTPAGERLMAVCLQAFSRYSEEITAQVGQGRFTTLTIYSHHSIASTWLIPRLADFHEAHPSLQLHVQTGNEPVTFTAACPVDVAVYYANGLFPGLESRLFMDEEIFPVCSPAYAERHDLTGQPHKLGECTLLADAAAWHFAAPLAEWQEWCGAQGLTLASHAPLLSFDTSAAAALAACHHMGLAMGRRRIVQSLLDEGKLMAPFPALPALRSDLGYYAVWPRAASLPPKVEIFLQWLHAAGN